ncbi:hypothetical protein [Hyphomonas johnsonii]|uniref:Anti-bacteriophage protein A/HamA C-terminal domain-containing protein n=1 Tax=Hyphomonas johnsonii MHS-2 TaxID=1280950 RepID=A0A059FSY1_9PROT|nr:hypothetical protein [Hyphomonas johnsonii]KCZ93528.1 hypothetical protein HJO_06725 [Hyphomonas johnsonii MHS-2]
MGTVEIEEGISEPPLSVEPSSINEHCIGERWCVDDDQQLAQLIVIIAMGQAAQASHILSELQAATPAFTLPELSTEAKIRLTVQEKKQTPRMGYPRWQRDGFIFEAISWIAARQTYGKSAYMKAPHVSATAQGLDGLMLELSGDKTRIDRVTVFEDKCSDNPIETFKYKVIPAFRDRHDNKRSAEIIAAAAALLGKAGIDDGTAARLAAAVTDRTKRRYRAAFAVTTDLDSEESRKELFEDYSKIGEIEQKQRVGACLVVAPELRDWFDKLAVLAIEYIESLSEGEANV